MSKKVPVFGIGIASVLTVFAVLSTLTVFNAIGQIEETNKFISDNIIQISCSANVKKHFCMTFSLQKTYFRVNLI